MSKDQRVEGSEISSTPGKSEHERIRDLEEQVAGILSNVEGDVADIEEVNPLKRTFMFPGTFATPFFPMTFLQTPLTEFLESGLVFAIPPLPNTIAQGSGVSSCGATTQVFRVTGNVNLSCVVELLRRSRCKNAMIQLKRGQNVRAQSPIATVGSSAGFGPIAAQANDVVEVVCSDSGGPKACQFNWQVNR